MQMANLGILVLPSPFYTLFRVVVAVALLLPLLVDSKFDYNLAFVIFMFCTTICDCRLFCISFYISASFNYTLRRIVAAFAI